MMGMGLFFKTQSHRLLHMPIFLTVFLVSPIDFVSWGIHCFRPLKIWKKTNKASQFENKIYSLSFFPWCINVSVVYFFLRCPFIRYCLYQNRWALHLIRKLKNAHSIFFTWKQKKQTETVVCLPITIPY